MRLHCRTGSSEIWVLGGYLFARLHCRTGSSEIIAPGFRVARKIAEGGGTSGALVTTTESAAKPFDGESIKAAIAVVGG